MDEKYEAKNVVNKIFEQRDRDASRIELEQTWFRNVLYYKGDQWIEWFAEEGVFKKQIPTEFVPTPVSNIIRDSLRAEKALILNKGYVPRIWPNSDTFEDKEAARIGEMLLQDMDLANDEEFKDEKDKAAFWMLLFGISFMRTFPDLNRGEYGIDKEGNIVKSGEVVSEAVLPFNIILDPIGDTLRKKRYVGVYSYKDKEWVEDNFGIKITTSPSRERLRYIHTLMKYVSEVTPWKTRRLDTGYYDDEVEDLVEFKELEFRPTKQFPNGRYIVMANDEILIDSDKLPITIDKRKNQWMYSLTDFHFNQMPGNYWSDSFVQDLISPQDIINQIDQALVMNRRSVGKPKIVLPTGTNLKRLNLKGDAYTALEYDPRTTAGVAPKFDNGMPLPNQVLDERNIHRGVAQDAAGDPKNVLRGQVPTAGASGELVNILQESAESAHTPDIGRFYRSLTRVYRKRLLLAKNLYTENRIIKVVGPNKQISIKKFKASDLRNNTDVRLELSSGIFKTKASQAHSMLNLIQTGMFENDPVTKMELLRKLGLSDMIGDRGNAHAYRAERENMKIAAGEFDGIFVTQADPNTGRPITTMDAGVVEDDPLFQLDNHAVHYDSHVRFALSDEFKELSLERQNRLIAHAMLHRVAMDAEIARMREQREEAQEHELEVAGRKPVEPELPQGFGGGMPGARPPAGGEPISPVGV